MSEYMFGVVRGRLTPKEVARRDRIAKANGAHGFVYVKDPGHGYMGWFTGPNLGHPFDRDLANRVLKAIIIKPTVEQCREMITDARQDTTKD